MYRIIIDFERFLGMFILRVRLKFKVLKDFKVQSLKFVIKILKMFSDKCRRKCIILH